MHSRLCFAALAAAVFAGGAAANDFEALARRLPESCNAVGYIDLQALMGAPLARSGGWDSKAELINVPSSVSRLVVGGQFSPAAEVHDWRFAVAALGRPVSVADLAKKLEGTATTIADRPAVFGKDNRAFVQLEPNVLAIHSASNRQELTRWVRMSAAATTLSLNSYLRDFVKANQAAQLRFALDAGDLFDAAGVRRSIDRLKVQGVDAALAGQAATLVSQMKGMSFSVRVGADIRGTLKIDFARDASALANVADALLRAALRENGYYLEDFDNFRTQVRGSSLFFEGPMTEAGLRQVVTGLMDTQQSMHTLADAPTSSGDQGMDSPAARTKRYFNGVLNLIDDLRRQKRTLRSTNEFAHWYEHTARRIDQLPVVGVDDMALDFGGTTADKLRACAQSLRGARIDVNRLNSHRRSASTVSGSGAVGTAWGSNFGYATGGAFFNNNFADVAQQQATVVAAGAQDRVEIWRQIDAAIGQTRRDLSRKFNVEF